MGTMSVKPLDGQEERERYFHRLLTDIAALEQMLEQGLIDRSQMHIGAEQEFCLVDENWNPSDKAMGLDVQTYMADDLLRMGDRMSMACPSPSRRTST